MTNLKSLILSDLRSVHNVGSIFRTANALGFDKIYLCGTTPTPLDKYGVARKDFLKVSLGAEKTILWEYVADTNPIRGRDGSQSEPASNGTGELVKKLRAEGYYVIAIEQDEKAVDYKAVNIEGKEKIAFVLGGEVDGLSRDLLDEVSVITEIPMLGTKESLNVAIAFGVSAYRILKI